VQSLSCGVHSFTLTDPLNCVQSLAQTHEDSQPKLRIARPKILRFQQQQEEEEAMTIENMPRVFRYSGLTLPDIDGLDVEGVRSLYAATYPEITTAAVTGPEAVDGKLVYTFTKAIGTKG